MSLEKYLKKKGIVKSPSQADMPHKGKQKSEDKEICDYAEEIETSEGKEKLDAMIKKMRQKPY